MDPSVVEQRLDNVARVRLVESRLLARIIKRHRAASGAVAHTRSYALSAAELASVADPSELGFDPAADRRPLILVARPPLRELSRLADRELFERVLRAAFHGRIHLELETKAEAGELDEVAIRRRIEAIGRAEFEELRSVFQHDDLLLPPGSDREVYIEFCATYLELSEFSPDLMITTFPGIDDHERMRAVIGMDLDLGAHLSGAPMPLLRPVSRTETIERKTGWLARLRHRRTLRAAERASRRQRHAASALLAARAAARAEQAADEPSQRVLAEASFALSARLRRALGFEELADDAATRRWALALARLAERTASATPARTTAESQLLYTLEEAAATHEASAVIVDVPSFLLSAGKRPAVRRVETKRDVRIALTLRRAALLLEQLQGSRTERAELSRLVHDAAARADQNARRVLAPKIGSALDSAELVAHSISERHAREKLVGELCDQVLVRGFFSLPQLRDAISNNDLKLRDLSGARELWHGDPLLAADRELSVGLDGIYRRGDIYLRALQKASSLPFGTRSGRLLTMYLVLPVLGAFVLLEGIRLLFGPLIGWLGFGTINHFGLAALSITAALLFGLLHSESFRALAREALDALGVALAWVFFRIPRALIAMPIVGRVLNQPWVRASIRLGLVPALAGAFVFVATPAAIETYLRVAVALASAALLSLVMSSRFGFWLEDWVVEQLAPTWRMLSRRWIPALFRLIAKSFAAALELFDRVIHRIDERISVQRSRSKILLAVAGGVGLVWSAAAYVVRLYVTLLVEPEINPIKHFPVVTVMHKLTLPMVPDALAALERPLAIFGPIVGGAIAGVTVFLLPSAFGFLAWELKSNHGLYRAAQPKQIQPARFGPHGETLHELLVPGLHSGTLPKLYDRLRRAAQRHADRRTSVALGRGASPARTLRLAAAEKRDIGRFRSGLAKIETALSHFVERELLAPLGSTHDPLLGALALSRIALSSNRIRIHLASRDEPARGCEIRFEQLGGRVLASLPRRDALDELDDNRLISFENALFVFYQRAQADLVHEQLAAELAEGAEYEINDERLFVFLDPEHRVELCYRLDAHRPKRLKPRIVRPARAALNVAERDALASRVLDTRRMLLAHQRIARRDWEAAWLAAEQGATPARLLAGPSLIGAQRTASRARPTE